MKTSYAESQTEQSNKKSVRLNYLDWLRVLAILGVFLFHAVHPFDMFPWEIKNAEQSVAVTLFIVFLALWGMPLFFLLSGVGSSVCAQEAYRRAVCERASKSPAHSIHHRCPAALANSILFPVEASDRDRGLRGICS